MPRPSIFADEWRDCQREHYKRTVRAGDAERRTQMADAMRRTGFSEAELSALYVAATMHVDDVPDGFVPDLDSLEAQRRQRAFQPHPDECTCPSCVPSLEVDQR